MKSYLITIGLFFMGILAVSNGYANCIFGDCENGRGSWQDDNGSTYSGEFKNKMRHGNGTFMDKEGSLYTGSWKYGVMHGKGIVRLSSGIKISGIWKNGKISGNNQYIYPNGEISTEASNFSFTIGNNGLLYMNNTKATNVSIKNTEEKEKIKQHLTQVIHESYSLTEEDSELIEVYSPHLNTETH